MEVMHDTTGKKEVVVCYMNAPIAFMIEENYGGCFFEDDVDLAQVLQDQVGCDRLLPYCLIVPMLLICFLFCSCSPCCIEILTSCVPPHGKLCVWTTQCTMLWKCSQTLHGLGC